MSLKELFVLEGHIEDRVWHVSWSPKGTHLATCGEDKVVRIWSSSTGDWEETSSIHCIATLEDAQTRTVRCCEWSPNGKHLACASFDGTVVVWESQNRDRTRWEQIAALEGHENEVKSVAWSRTGQWLATCGRDKKIWVWERIFNNNSYEFECVSMLDGHTQDVKFVSWHPRADNTLFSCSYDDTIKVWGCDEGDDEFYCLHTMPGHGNTVWGLTVQDQQMEVNDLSAPFVPRPTRIATCSADLSVKLWEHEATSGGDINNILTGAWREAANIENLHRFPIYSISWNTDASVMCHDGSGSDEIYGGLIATGGGDNDIHVLTVATDTAGMPVMKKVQTIAGAHDGDVNCVRWGPRIDPENETDRYLAKMRNDGTYGGGEEEDNQTLPCSHILASAADDGTAKLWKLVM